MRLSFWGVRGSTPAPERDAWRYGGNTPCLELRAGDQLFILDAGTGIRELGRQLLAEFRTPGLEANLFLTHYHYDHIQGLPFFEPIYFRGNTIHIFGPVPQAEAPSSLPGVLQALFRAPFFPVAAHQLQGTYFVQELEGKSDFAVGATRIRTCLLSHPQGSLAYRFDHDGVSIVYATDHEPGNPDFDQALRHLARNADLLISDAQYRPEELGAQKAGWGHGSWEASARLAREAGVKHLVLFHHEPVRTDLELDEILLLARQAFPNTWAATEGMVLDVSHQRVRVGSRAGRLSQRAPLHVPIEVETTKDGGRQREEVQLENLSVQGAYFLSSRPYELQQPVDLAVQLSTAGNGQPRDGDPLANSDVELRLRGYVLRTEPQTTNGGWMGVAVHFPGGEARSKRSGEARPPGDPKVGND